MRTDRLSCVVLAARIGSQEACFAELDELSVRFGARVVHRLQLGLGLSLLLPRGHLHEVPMAWTPAPPARPKLQIVK